MKTKFLFAAAFFITTTGMSQSISGKSQASSRINATASSVDEHNSASSAVSTGVSTNASAHAAAKTETAARTSSEIKHAAKSRVETVKNDVKDDYQDVKQEVRADRQTGAHVKAGSTAKIETEHNKASANASINTGSDVSTQGSVHQAKAMVKSSKSAKVKTANAALAPKIGGSIGSRSAIMIR